MSLLLFVGILEVSVFCVSHVLLFVGVFEVSVFFACEVFASDGRCDACVWGRSPDDGKVGAVKWLKVVESVDPAHSGDMGEATNHSYRRPGGILSTAQEHGTRNDRGIEHALSLIHI